MKNNIELISPQTVLYGLFKPIPLSIFLLGISTLLGSIIYLTISISYISFLFISIFLFITFSLIKLKISNPKQISWTISSTQLYNRYRKLIVMTSKSTSEYEERILLFDNVFTLFIKIGDILHRSYSKESKINSILNSSEELINGYVYYILTNNTKCDKANEYIEALQKVLDHIYEVNKDQAILSELKINNPSDIDSSLNELNTEICIHNAVKKRLSKCHP